MINHQPHCEQSNEFRGFNDKFEMFGLLAGLRVLLDANRFSLRRLDDEDNGLPAFIKQLGSWFNEVRMGLPRLRSGDYSTVADEMIELLERGDKNKRALENLLKVREINRARGLGTAQGISQTREALVNDLKDFEIYLNSLQHKIN